MPEKKQRKRCKECVSEGITTNRVAKYPGPRCYTHHRARRRKASSTQHSKHLTATYGITTVEYWQIYEYQNGKCFICQRATGARKRLAVDHDHKTGYVRGLLCGTCNRKVIGHLRDDPQALERGAQYLRHPPAFAVIGKRKVPNP